MEQLQNHPRRQTAGHTRRAKSWDTERNRLAKAAQHQKLATELFNATIQHLQGELSKKQLQQPQQQHIRQPKKKRSW